MALAEIPREAWATFFEDLSREHENGLVTVEVRGQPIPQQPAISEMRLLGISFEEKGSGAGRLAIMVGDDTDTNTSHTVASPTTVKVQNGGNGDIETLLIDAQEGEPVTLIHFLSAT